MEIQFTKVFYEAGETANSSRKSLHKNTCGIDESRLHLGENGHLYFQTEFSANRIKRRNNCIFTARASSAPRAERMLLTGLGWWEHTGNSLGSFLLLVNHQQTYTAWHRAGYWSTNVKIKHCGFPPKTRPEHVHTHTHTHQTAELPNPHCNVLQLACVLFDDDLLGPAAPPATWWICHTNLIIGYEHILQLPPPRATMSGSLAQRGKKTTLILLCNVFKSSESSAKAVLW